MVNEQKIQNIIQKVQSQTPLSQSEIDYVNSLEGKIDENLRKQILIINKQVSGQELDNNEKEFMQKLQAGQQQLPVSHESQLNKQRFDEEQKTAKFQINHITDIHNTADTFENVLLSNLVKSEHLEYDKNGNIVIQGRNHKLKDGVSIAITGDVGSDFFDQQNHGLEAFLSQTIIDKGGYTKTEAEEVRDLYLYVMHMSGLDEDMIQTMNPEAFGEGGAFQKFHAYLFGITEPQFMTQDEKEEFLEKRERLHYLLKKGMKHHARREYNEIKETLEKYELTPNEVVFVTGNHDLPEVFEEVLGDYLLKPGETREVSGLKFGNVVDSANGNFTGSPYFNDTFGYAGLREEIEEQRYQSKPFKDIQEELNNVGIHFTDRELKRLFDISIQKAAMGIGTGALKEYHVNKIKPILEDFVKDRVSGLKNNLPKDADVILQHSMIDHPQNAGIEEKAAYDLITKELPNSVILHGHEHTPTPHRKDEVFNLNPGSAGSGNNAVHLFDNNKQYNSSLFKSLDEGLNDVYKHMRKEELPGHPSGRYQKAG